MKRKSILWKLLIVFGVIFIISGSSLAYFIAETAQARNKFKTSYVNIAVQQKGNPLMYEDNAEGRSNLIHLEPSCNLNDFFLINKDQADYPTGDTYVRARLVPICRDANGNGAAIEVEVGFQGGDNWEKRTDGYYYFKQPLEANEVTDYFSIDTSNAVVPNGYQLEVQILADGIQAYVEGLDYKEAWNIP